MKFIIGTIVTGILSTVYVFSLLELLNTQNVLHLDELQVIIFAIALFLFNNIIKLIIAGASKLQELVALSLAVNLGFLVMGFGLEFIYVFALYSLGSLLSLLEFINFLHRKNEIMNFKPRIVFKGFSRVMVTILSFISAGFAAIYYLDQPPTDEIFTPVTAFIETFASNSLKTQLGPTLENITYITDKVDSVITNQINTAINFIRPYLVPSLALVVFGAVNFAGIISRIFEAIILVPMFSLAVKLNILKKTKKMVEVEDISF
jgi:hypothetical protein